MYKILMPSDFSKNAYGAVRYAVELFRAFDCTFYLFNSYQRPPSGGSMLEVLDDILEKEAVRSLNAIKSSIKTDLPGTHHRFETLTMQGALDRNLTKIVNEKGIDLIVMGTKGSSGIKENVLGSNTAKVLKKVGCSLLTIPIDWKFNGMEKVLILSDYSILPIGLSNSLFYKILEKRLADVSFYSSQTSDEQADWSNLPSSNFSTIALDTESFTSSVNEFIHENNPDLLALFPKKGETVQQVLRRSANRNRTMKKQVPMLIMQTAG